MARREWLGAICFVFFLGACSESTSSPTTLSADAGDGGRAAPSDAGATETDAAPLDADADSGAAGVEPSDCTLRDDPGSPGQYSDRCVRRSWIAAYAGTYASTNCELTISAGGTVAASFKLTIRGEVLPGVHTADWEGGTGTGNDSYYRFTTDSTFTVTKGLNFNAGKDNGGGAEEAISLRVNDLDRGLPTFTGNYQRLAGEPMQLDCGVYSRR